MKTSTSLALLTPLVGTALAQRPSNTSICDYYTTALLMNNTADNQYALVTLVVNTAAIGNYTTPNVGVSVPGILAPGEVNGTAVNLAGYFNGGFASTNRGGSSGVSVNFLDGGGAAPLMMNKPANDESSNQYKLLTHLYQYFGALLGCSAMDYPSYMGQASQYEVHKFMDLDVYQMTWFIEQVGLAAASFGVTDEDVTAVGTALNSLFNYRCLPETTVIPAQGPQLQSMCVADTCPLAANATCSSYEPAMMPAVANASLVGNATMSGSPSSTGSAPAVSSFTGAAHKISFGMGTVLLAVAAFVL